MRLPRECEAGCVECFVSSRHKSVLYLLHVLHSFLFAEVLVVLMNCSSVLTVCQDKRSLSHISNRVETLQCINVQSRPQQAA